MNSRLPASRIEALEARIAPALVLQNPLVDLVAGSGKTTTSIDLAKMFDTSSASTSRTHVVFVTNVDSDPSTAGLQPGIIEIELYDDLAPLTVQNFINYVNAKNSRGDYDNTIIHRQVDFGTNGVADGAADFIQGGGFEFGNLGSHIPVGANLLNEYSDLRPNERGTIAMGKIGGDPNSASSEWFINAADNSDAFGSSNLSAGGYTVFGQVVSGLEIVDAITTLAMKNLSGGGTDAVAAVNSAFASVPMQGGYSSGTPTADQYVRITDAYVVTGAATGITYTATSSNLSLVKTSVKGSTLNLTYAGKAGSASVTVTGKNALGETTTDTFDVTLGANLATTFVSDGLQLLTMPGDVATMKINVTNSGSANFSGPVKIEYFLSQSRLDGSDPDGTLLDAGDVLITTVASRNLTLAPGKSAVIATTVTVPPELVAEEGLTYRVLAKVTPLNDSTILSGTTGDDVARLSGQHGLFNRAGAFTAEAALDNSGRIQFTDFSSGQTPQTVGRSGSAVLKYVQDDGNPDTVDPLVSVAVKGPGAAKVTPGEYDLFVGGTTAASKLTATVVSGQSRVLFDDIAIDSVIGTVDFGKVDVRGNVALSGGVQTLKLGNLPGPGLLTIGAYLPANTTKATVTLGRVQDYSFESYMPVRSLTAVEWLDSDDLPETLSFLSLDTLSITGAKNVARGDLQASVEVVGGTSVGSITVAGFLTASTVTTVGNIGSITLGGIEQSSVFAGTTARPAELDDFSAARTLSKFTIKGIAGYVGDLFIDSQVAAQTLGSVSVQKIGTTGSAGAFGFVADVIKSYNRGGGSRLSNQSLPGTFDGTGDYSVTVL
jgi:cyclophilin family peptidyl-prolyl cis-trans isomerase